MTTKQILFLFFMLGTIHNIGLTMGKTNNNVSIQQTELNENLLYAAQRGDFIQVKELLEHGANPNTKDNNGNTPLHLLPWGQEEIVDPRKNDAITAFLLLNYGANPNEQNNGGNTPAHNSACNSSVLYLLAANNADFTVKNGSGRTPLDHARKLKYHSKCPGEHWLNEYNLLKNKLRTTQKN